MLNATFTYLSYFDDIHFQSPNPCFAYLIVFGINLERIPAPMLRELLVINLWGVIFLCCLLEGYVFGRFRSKVRLPKGPRQLALRFRCLGSLCCSRSDPCSVDFGHELPNSDLNYAVDFLVDVGTSPSFRHALSG